MQSLSTISITSDRDVLEGVRDQNGRMLDEIIRNYASGKKVKNILLIGLPSAGKSSMINSLACLILGNYVPVASVGQGAAQLTHTYAAHRYNHFGICEEHLRGSPNEDNARIIHPYLPNLHDFVGLADANTEELKEILSLQIFGYLEPGLQITSLFDIQRRHGVGALKSWYTKSEEAWKIDIVLFVHSVTTNGVPRELIQCLLDVIKPKDTLRPVDVEFYVVLTKMDKVETGVVTDENVNAIENAVADLFGIHGFKEYKLVKMANWCDDVGFPNSAAVNLDGSDERSVTLNNQLLKLLHNMSTPKSKSKIAHDITLIQKMWFYLYSYITTIIRTFDTEPYDARDILYVVMFGLIVIIAVLILLLL
ncbi:hypothetical protein ACJMK2_026811 [Sinanodonta woodiana]|uniref:G domain-containing protein n=1 Tax=Sinanodonta woodiana TaxID=1069815 RepID=A0ABD3XN26_SINWO